MRCFYCILILTLFLIPGLNSALTTLATIKGYRELSTLASIINSVNANDIKSLFSNTSQYTLFAPSDQAFDDMSINNGHAFPFIDTLKYHIIPRKVHSTTLKSHQFQPTLLNDASLVNLPENKTQVLDIRKNGHDISISYGLGGARISEADIETSNGIIHLIDHILSPPTSPSKVMEAANLTYFLELMRRTSLINTLDKLKGVTIFAPTNTALEAFDENRLKGMTLLDLLKYHIVIPTVGYTMDLKNGALQSLHGASLIINSTDTSVTVNNVELVTRDILTNNGVLHIVDSILKPGLVMGINAASSNFSGAFKSATSILCLLLIITPIF